MARAGGTGERVAREPLTGRVTEVPIAMQRSGPVGERATPTLGQDPRGTSDYPRWIVTSSESYPVAPSG
jgi:hypothetical protein